VATSEAKLPLTVAIITLNAASLLRPCLASVGFADEALLVDSGSTDGTVELAQALQRTSRRGVDLACARSFSSFSFSCCRFRRLPSRRLAQAALHGKSTQ